MSDTVANLAIDGAPFAGDEVTVRSRVGADGNTVVGVDGATQAVGDQVSANANAL